MHMYKDVYIYTMCIYVHKWVYICMHIWKNDLCCCLCEKNKKKCENLNWAVKGKKSLVRKWVRA